MAKIDTAEKRRWKEAVTSVLDSAQEWAKERGWPSSKRMISISEENLGTYELPLLTIESATGQIVLEPIARWSSPGDGRIDVYGWPSLNRLMLVRKGADWTLFTEAGVRWPQRWSLATFSDLATNLNAAA